MSEETRYVVISPEGEELCGFAPDGSPVLDFEPKHGPCYFHTAAAAIQTARQLTARAGNPPTPFLVSERRIPAEVIVTRLEPAHALHARFHAVEVELMCLPTRKGGKRNPGNRPLGGPPTWRDGR